MKTRKSGTLIIYYNQFSWIPQGNVTFTAKLKSTMSFKLNKIFMYFNINLTCFVGMRAHICKPTKTC